MDAKKDYSHVISGYRNELRLNGKATLSAYCRSVGVSISAVHHWMENYGITTKKIKAEMAELAGCDSPFVPLSSEMPVPVRSSSRIELTFPNGVLLSADQYPLSGSAFVFFSRSSSDRTQVQNVLPCYIRWHCQPRRITSTSLIIL